MEQYEEWAVGKIGSARLFPVRCIRGFVFDKKREMLRISRMDLAEATQLYFLARRRDRATPTMPAPSSNRVEGSGTGAEATRTS